MKHKPELCSEVKFSRVGSTDELHGFAGNVFVIHSLQFAASGERKQVVRPRIQLSFPNVLLREPSTRALSSENQTNAGSIRWFQLQQRIYRLCMFSYFNPPYLIKMGPIALLFPVVPQLFFTLQRPAI